MSSGNRLPLAAFLLTVLFTGFNAIGVRLTVLELPPFWGATLRFAPAALLLFLLAFALKLPLPKGRALLGAVIFGTLNFGLSYAFIYWGLSKVQPGMGTVILALGPLFTLLFAIAHHQETFRWQALLGALLAAGGIAIVFREQIRTNVPLFSLLAIVLGAVSIAEGSVLAKGFPRSHPITTNAVGMGVGAFILFVMSLLWKEKWSLPTLTSTWIALVYLILIGSCTVFILFLYILKRWPASTLSYQYVLMPFITLAASARLEHEALSSILLVGAVLVLSGVFLGAISFSIRKGIRSATPAD